MAAAAEVPRKLWEHPNSRSTLMFQFMQDVNRRHGLNLKTFWDLHTYSLRHKSPFWAQLFEATGFIYEGAYERVVDEAAPIDTVPRWFEGVQLNFAENVLYSRASAISSSSQRGTQFKHDAKTAVTEIREGAADTPHHVSWGELRRRAGQLAAAMTAAGVRKGDRVVAVGSNSVDTLLVLLATTWCGAVFSSAAPDMGVRGILQRAVQVNPRLLFMDDAVVYRGATTDLRANMADVVAGLEQGCSEFVGAVAVPRFAIPRDVTMVKTRAGRRAFVTTLREFLAERAPAETAPPDFVRAAFHDPLLICYSSGTTGAPKAIVHTAGGLMLNYWKEGRLHEELGPDSVTLQFTTAGWIMYVANVGSLLFGARAVFYDGSPFTPGTDTLVRVAAAQRVTKLGISPRWLLELARAGVVPRDVADLSSLQVVTCTGMPLSDELFAWFYDVAFPRHTHLANISGGTDIAGCFGLMNPLTPVYVGGTQGPSLGVHAAAYDALLPSGGPGREVPDGTPGELVAVASFPNMPAYFWGDSDSTSQTGPAPPGSRYHKAYFARFAHVWAHGDFVCVHPTTKNMAFLGRADGVLNPSGVRFGPAEIYSVVERRFADRVADSLCVGQRRPGVDADERVLLFLLMQPGQRLNAGLVRAVREAVAQDLSRRHVPAHVFETPEIPTTINGKKVELPVKQIVSGATVTPSSTLANPKSLDFFYQFQKVEELVEPRAKM